MEAWQNWLSLRECPRGSAGMGYDHPGASSRDGAAQVWWYGFAVGVVNGDDLRFVEVSG